MNRRRFLTFCGLGIATAGGYFGWRRYHLPSIPEGMKVGTQHIEGDIFVEDSSRDSKFLEWQEESQTLITKRKEVNREIIDGESISPFLNDIDFKDSYLIVVQNGMRSEMELVLDGIFQREYGFHLNVSIDSPRGGPDDLLTHSLLIRVINEDGEVPEEISIDIKGYV